MICFFCVFVGFEGLVEVCINKLVCYMLEFVVVEGVLVVFNDDFYGFYYCVDDGNVVN